MEAIHNDYYETSYSPLPQVEKSRFGVTWTHRHPEVEPLERPEVKHILLEKIVEHYHAHITAVGERRHVVLPTEHHSTISYEKNNNNKGTARIRKFTSHCTLFR